jgi:hypothetical protein
MLLPQDPGICCRMSDPKLPNSGTYVRVIFRQFCPHSDPTYPFGPLSVRITDQTSTSSRNVRTKDRTYILGQNVRIKPKKIAAINSEQVRPPPLTKTLTSSVFQNPCAVGRKTPHTEAPWQLMGG